MMNGPGGGRTSENRKPCCAAAEAARQRYLEIGGHRIAISHLDEIFDDARAVAQDGESALRRELLRLVKIYNYVPPPAENAYEDALFAGYLALAGKGRERGVGGK